MTANLFLIAAPRAGSTQFALWLATHPEIGLSPVKEPNHFSAHEFPEDYVRRSHLNDIDPARYVAAGCPRPAQFAVFRERALYARLFARLGTRWRVDASTSYLACPEAPELIRGASPAARAITLTRDPVDRAISHYRLAVRTGRTRRTLAAELHDERSGRTPLPACFLLRPSRQAEGVARVAACFSPDRHLPLRFEELVTSPAEVLSRVAGFLGLDPGGFDLTVEARNAAAAPRFPALNAMLLRSGAKTRLRRVLPPDLKRPLKRVYFSSGRPIAVTDAERNALAAALEGRS